VPQWRRARCLIMLNEEGRQPLFLMNRDLTQGAILKRNCNFLYESLIAV